MADKVWHCKSCNHVESAQDEYKVGDSEPCVHCKDGTARVYSANGFDPDFHNKVVVATGIPREYFPLNFEDAKPKSKVGVEVIEEFPACSPDMSRLFEIQDPEEAKRELMKYNIPPPNYDKQMAKEQELPPLVIDPVCEKCGDKEEPFAMAMVGEEEKLLCESCIDAQGGDGFTYASTTGEHFKRMVENTPMEVIESPTFPKRSKKDE